MPTPTTMPLQMVPVYRFYFLWWEPFGAIGGAYLCLFQPTLFLHAVSLPPLFPLLADAPTPVTTFLLTNIAALYLFFGLIEGVGLRCTQDLSMWRVVLGSIAVCDAGHLAAVWGTDPEGFWNPAGWRAEDWINVGTLWCGLILRLAFLAGVGIGGRKVVKGRRS